jgi:hypothetical protein
MDDEELITPDHPDFEGEELTAEKIHALKVDNAGWMQRGRWRWSGWSAEVATGHHSASWDHDHCHFCHSNAFSEQFEGDLREGWTAEWFPEVPDGEQRGAGYYWVCPPCFDDLRHHFEWSVAD